MSIFSSVLFHFPFSSFYAFTVSVPVYWLPVKEGNSKGQKMQITIKKNLYNDKNFHDTMHDVQCWEGYFGNVIGYRLQVTLSNVISSVTISITLLM